MTDPRLKPPPWLRTTASVWTKETTDADEVEVVFHAWETDPACPLLLVSQDRADGNMPLSMVRCQVLHRTSGRTALSRPMTGAYGKRAVAALLALPIDWSVSQTTVGIQVNALPDATREILDAICDGTWEPETATFTVPVGVFLAGELRAALLPYKGTAADLCGSRISGRSAVAVHLEDRVSMLRAYLRVVDAGADVEATIESASAVKLTRTARWVVTITHATGSATFHVDVEVGIGSIGRARRLVAEQRLTRPAPVAVVKAQPAAVVVVSTPAPVAVPVQVDADLDARRKAAGRKAAETRRARAGLAPLTVRARLTVEALAEIRLRAGAKAAATRRARSATPSTTSPA